MAWYEDSQQKTVVREYKSTVALQADADKAAAYGWSVASVNELSQRSGCLRGCTLGLLALVWKPKSHVMATFTHA